MITLGEMQTILRSYPEGTILKYGIGQVFSWRGAYDEPCFTIERDVNIGHCLQVIDEALCDEFRGWKGGVYEYNGSSPVNFETGPSAYTPNEGYLRTMMVAIGQCEDPTTIEVWEAIAAE